ncbi:unnamed protein product [Rotaria sp. Silwood2]|nr:unnamed protein product [Rotaria sp. Silwood2]CAF2965418.1 unnamed protein product [Rotaria sp. Silwood2]CAF3229868.1 unnamed protein product [Rotaria sp. Silwood2]CAF3333648.1 unnamed protein product [Rotaria sp. Silwood2]CAF4000604.1 unnamed protein product [Rotaria sp. Silwood2]
MSVVSPVKLTSRLDQKMADGVVSGELTRLKAQQKLAFRTCNNVLVICTAFFLLFTAFQRIGNLQSSLNIDANISVNSLSIIFACLIISSIFLPHPLIAVFGLKWTLAIFQVP